MLFWLSATGMPLSVVSVGRLAMKSFLLSSNRDPGNMTPAAVSPFRKRRLLTEPPVDRLAFARNRAVCEKLRCMHPLRNDFASIAAIARALRQSANPDSRRRRLCSTTFAVDFSFR
jgi:hypothetical protein